jgi:predicted MPP superfamily phosphohydrolase
MIYLSLLVAAIGHVVFWATVVNRIHGLGIERRWVDGVTILSALAMGGLPPVIALLFWLEWPDSLDASLPATGAMAIAWSYLYFCIAVCIFSALHRLWLKFHPERRGALQSNHTSRVDMRPLGRSDLTAPGIPRWLAHIPGNQLFDLQIHEKRITLPNMPAGRELRIAHITDLHMSGRVTKQYFEQVVAAVNELEPDAIMLTGDLVERRHCMEWLPDTLGKLRAPGGVYFVLGNHDLRVDYQHLLAELARLGLKHVGGTTQSLTIRDVPVVLAGNELPWLGPAPDVDALPPRDASGLPLRILLAHTPDQFTWAHVNDFDLILAGHNHGGQIQLPILGPILAPSLSGVRYACGTFRRGTTVLHVSRGTGGLTPFRWNCPPEIALLVLEPDS